MWSEKMKQLWSNIQLKRARKMQEYHLSPLQLRRKFFSKKGKK